jgi:hypothetical protein
VDEAPSDSKVFGISMPFWLSSMRGGAPKSQSSRASLSKIKLHTELSFQDISSVKSDRLRLKIRSARDVNEVWMLRSDVHQMIAREINQQEAALRINALMPLFEGWIPAKALTSI